MKNLMTRKIVLGILMTLVLAFSVQGIVEAVSPPNSGTEFGSVRILETQTDRNLSTTSPTITLSLAGEKENQLENISISASSGVDLSMGTNYFRSGTTTLNEVENEAGATDSYTFRDRYGTQRSAITTLTVNFISKGKKTVSISGTNYWDHDTNAATALQARSWSYTYVYYVSAPSTTDTAFVSVKGLTSGYVGTPQIKIHSADGNHYRVQYTVTGGTLSLGAPDTNFDTPTLTSGSYTSSAFDVYLNLPATTTATVTADVEGSVVSTKGVYIQGTPTLSVDSPGDTELGGKMNPGTIDSILPDAFEATVNDGNGTPVPGGVVVTFQVIGSGTGGGWLVFPPTTDPATAGELVDSNNNTNNKQRVANGAPVTADTAKLLYVRTDATGVARVNFQFGTDVKQDVRVSAVGKSEIVSAYTDTVASADRLVNPSSKLRNEKYDLRVVVQNADRETQSGRTVRFSTRPSDGQLEPAAGGDGADTITDTTDNQGVAFVVFAPASNSRSANVTVDLLDLGGDGNVGGGDDSIVDQIVINVRGGTVTPREPDQPQQRTDALSFNIGTSITGNEGDEINLEVTARDRDGFTVSGVPVTFRISDSDVGSLSVTSGDTAFNGVLRTTLTLGDEDGTITATTTRTGYEPAQASITITPTPTDLEVLSGNDQSGTPGNNPLLTFRRPF